jgi:HD-GYP domain-containing protein (c-di-GMP phosphodiesterase class II)
MFRPARKFELHVYIAILFLALMVGFAAVNITMQYLQTRQMMLSASTTLFGHIDRETRAAIASRYDGAIFAADMLAETGLAGTGNLAERLKSLPILVRALRDQPSLSSAYVGYDSGDFFLVRGIPSGSWLAGSLKPPAGAAYLVQSVARGELGMTEGRYLFFDETLRLLEDRSMPNYVFDPRRRPWFTAASEAAGVAVTAPYLFFTTREVGTTFARRSPDGHAVAGVDVTLAALSDLLRSLRPTPSAELVVFDDHGEVLADADAGQYPLAAQSVAVKLPEISDLGRPVLASIAGTKPKAAFRMLPVETLGGTWQGLVSMLAEPGAPFYLALAAPQAELLAQATKIRNQSLTVAFAVMLIAAAFTLVCARLASRPLVALTREAAAIQALKFDRPVAVHSFITEIDLLARTMGTMKSTIQRFLDVGAILAGERRFDRLLERILVETIRLASARGGIVYLAEPDGTLKCALARWDGRATLKGPPDLRPDADKDHPVIRATVEGGLSTVMTSVDLARWYPGFQHHEPLATLAVPLKTRQGEIVGALMLSQDPEVLKDASEREVLALVEGLSGTAATAIESQRLILEQKHLLESFIELIAGAIDRKSPYTGGHCQRVPELTKMIARAAEAATDGPFRDFALSEMQWEELHIAAWLHDCGKVTTPEYVVDKATKLETIYDRLHEVRMRFEVLKREAEVACWKAIAEGAAREEKLLELRGLWAVLDEEFAFVATCNEGGERMAAEHIERLKEIAKRQWTRTLDDRLGLSQEEKLRKARSPTAALPASEPLLADKPEHVFERRDQDRIAPDNPWGFKIQVPEKLYDRGEIHNLTVGRGTLTAEDRYKINEHMVETIRMLSRLPLPRHLSQVVEIAGGHHEKMDGTGYPRRLRRDQMSWPARMMAIADIFEALTAADRPYKKGKPLSEALAIMARMRDEAHIDPDIFELFLSAGVYRTYAERYLRPEQIDAIDPARYRPNA